MNFIFKYLEEDEFHVQVFRGPLKNLAIFWLGKVEEGAYTDVMMIGMVTGMVWGGL